MQIRNRTLTALALLVASCRSENQNPAPPALVVQVARVARQDVANAVEVSGTLEPLPGRDVKLGALVTGRVAEILVAEGDRVKAGQLLASIEATPLRDAVAQAKAALAQARAQDANASIRWQRTAVLFDAGIAAGQEVDDTRAQEVAAKSAVRAAEAALSTAENQLRRSELRAPFDGLVAHVFTAAGEPVDGSGKPVLEVADTTTLELRAGLAAGQAERIHPDQAAEVRVDGLPDRPFPGKVIAVSPVINPATGVATVRIRVENPQLTLKGGTLGRARIITDLHRGVLAVPREALVPMEQNGLAATSTSAPREVAVERVEPNGEAKRQPVSIGATDLHYVEVRSGLKEGDLVIIQGAYALPDGTRVQVAGSAPDGGSPTPAPQAGAP